LAGNVGFVIAKLRKALANLPYLPRALMLVWQASRSWTTAWLVLLIVQGLLPVATVYLSRPLVNSIAAAIRSGGTGPDVRRALLLVGAMGGILLLTEALHAAASWIRTAQSELVQDHISSLVHRKSAAADMAFYDSPEFYDHLHRARSEASYRPVALVESLGNILQNGITLAAMLAVLIPFGPWLPAALLASTLPACYTVIRHTFRQYHWRLRNTAEERRAWYYDWLLTGRETAAELRLFGLASHFQAAYDSLRLRLRNERIGLARGQSLSEMGAGAIALLITAAALASMVWRVARGAGSLGDLAMFYQAFHQGLRLMRSLLENVGQVYANVLFLGNLFEFLALEPKIVDPGSPVPAPPAVKTAIRFHGVSFRYPGSGRPAIEDFDLTIPAGTVAAVVGPNGAGKSTLIKLLCRFYDPQRGRIEIDGVELREMRLDELRGMITVLFQEPVHYSATAAENIALGDLGSAPGIREIEIAARQAGADEPISRLPLGYNNLLGKWFAGGAELSVGEWQRLALARAFLRRAPILILDEPTSAMDPWAEADWLERFRRLASGRTAIIITHRFTTAMHADVIHLLELGKIVESGNHQSLMAQGGRYAQWWASQMKSSGPAIR
jgi:ATP-binding cassette subfamily B protein